MKPNVSVFRNLYFYNSSFYPIPRGPRLILVYWEEGKRSASEQSVIGWVTADGEVMSDDDWTGRTVRDAKYWSHYYSPIETPPTNAEPQGELVEYWRKKGFESVADYLSEAHNPASRMAEWVRRIKCSCKDRSICERCMALACMKPEKDDTCKRCGARRLDSGCYTSQPCEECP